LPAAPAPAFRGGRNIALKVPGFLYDATVAFYRDTLALPLLERHDASTVFAFGPVRLWVDRVAALSRSEVWLEVVTPDTAAAAIQLGAAGVVRCDEVEALPPGFDGFWVAGPGGTVHLVAGADD
jgi:catechol 2,3-dioxygenase-like lactoylglutathione lyase family enzyme